MKAQWRANHHRGRRPGVWSPGDMLVFDWGEIGPLFVFCAVLAWSRVRFVFFADNLGAEATMTALARCFEYLGGVPKTALTDRMGCLKGDTVAGLVVPTPAYVRFATHYGFRPDFCQGADPESKGLVENLVGYVKSDLMIPEDLSVADLATANEKGLSWCDEVNAVMHSEICAIPAERLVKELEVMGTLPSLRATIGKLVVRKVDRLSCVRFGSARYSVPTIHIGRQVELVAQDGKVLIIFLGEIIATHDLVAPGETSVLDEHYGGPRPMPTRAVRPKTSSEKAFCALGPGSGVLHQRCGRPGDHLAQGRPRRAGPHGGRPWKRRAVGRTRTCHLVREVPSPRRALDHRGRHRRPASVRSRRRPHRRAAPRADALAERLRHRRALVSTAPPALPADIEAGLRRLRLRAMRSALAELLVTAKTQRWKPEEFLRTLIEAEIASRDASNAANRLKAASFPVTKTLDEFDVVPPR